jgi:hypothetical protein
MKLGFSGQVSEKYSYIKFRENPLIGRGVTIKGKKMVRPAQLRFIACG